METELLLTITADELVQFLTTGASADAITTTASIDGRLAADEEDKRTRRTEIERLSRRRRQATLRSMRDDVKQLEMHFASLMAGHSKLRAAGALCAPHEPLEDVGLTDWSSEEPSLGQLRERFIDVTLAIERMEEQQKELRQMLRAKQLLTFSLQSLARTFVDDWHDTLPLPVGETVEYAPLHAEEYFRFMRDAYKEMTTFDALLARDHSGGKYMGWTSRQYVPRESPNQSVPVSLTKTFPGRKAESLARDSWDLFCSEARQKQILNDWSNGLHCRVLYELNEDVIVVYQTFKRRHVEKRFHSVLLLFRVQTEDSFVVGTRTIPTPSIQDALKAPDKWTDVCTWLHVRQLQTSEGESCESGVEVAFATAHAAPLPVPISHLNMNFFTTVLRWENAVATPMALTWS